MFFYNFIWLLTEHLLLLRIEKFLEHRLRPCFMGRDFNKYVVLYIIRYNGLRPIGTKRYEDKPHVI